MAQILILVGTESGNAQMVADALKPVLEGAGHAVDVNDKAASVGDLEAHDVLLVICATHGSGDIPTNILPLAETLERERPNLSGHRYGVISGRGHSEVEDETVEWTTGACIYTPPWTWHRHYNDSAEHPVEFLTIENSRLLGLLGVGRRQSAGLVTVEQARARFKEETS